VNFSEARDLFEIIFQIPGSSRKLVDCGLILKKLRGLSAKYRKLKFTGIIFLKENMLTKSMSPWTGGAPGSTVDRGGVDRGRWSSPVLTGDGGGGRASRGGAREVLTGARAVAKRRRTRGSKQQRLELVARAKEGAKELGRAGMRCGEGRGSHRPFIGAGGAPGRCGLGGGG
jgi:hypothetical protein